MLDPSDSRVVLAVALIVSVNFIVGSAVVGRGVVGAFVGNWVGYRVVGLFVGLLVGLPEIIQRKVQGELKDSTKATMCNKRKKLTSR